MTSKINQDDLYSILEKVIEHRSDSSALESITEAIGQPNLVYSKHERTFYQFWKHGVYLDYRHDSDQFSCAVFHFRTVAVKSGDIQAYRGKLIQAIDSNDHPTDVQQKLGIQPFFKSEERQSTKPRCSGCDDTDNHWERYLIRGLEVSFLFRTATGPVSMVSIRNAQN